MEISGNSFDFDDMFSGSPEQKDGMRGGAGSRTPGQLGTIVLLTQILRSCICAIQVSMRNLS